MKNVISTISITGFDISLSGLRRTIESVRTFGEKMSEENFLRCSTEVGSLDAIVSLNFSHLWIEKHVTLEVSEKWAECEKWKECQHHED